jgi:hypothetical protein
VEPSPAVLSLVQRRAQAREQKDYAAADALRVEIRRAGWIIKDTAGEPILQDAWDSVDEFDNAAAVPSRLNDRDCCAYSLCLAVYGWPEDVARLLSGMTPPADLEVVAVDVRGAGITPRQLVRTRTDWPVRVICAGAELGHADALNIASRQSCGRLLFYVEPSLEFGLPVLGALAAALDDPGVGLVGPFGLARKSREEFEAIESAEVDALEYLVAMRRADFAKVGPFDQQYRFYRNLEIDYSFQARAAGLQVRRVECGPITRHAHRLYDSTPPQEREKLSRKNYNRFLSRWGEGSAAGEGA